MGLRALSLLAAVAVPAFALGLSAGQVTANPAEVGQTSCASTSTTDLTWTIDTSKTGRNATTNDTYRIAVYLSGTACPDPGAAPGSTASNVVANVSATGNTQTAAVAYATLAAKGPVLCPSPWTAASDQDENLCVYLVDSTGVVGVSGATGAPASGTFLFQLARPPAPVLVSVEPANEALIASFQAGTSGTPDPLDTATSGSYRVDASLSGSVVASATGAQSPIRVNGLANNTTYDVTVVALSPSPALNESVASGSMAGTPLPFDSFWTAYQNAGGREQGGCGGGAGALSLLALLPLALRRRRP